MEGALIGSAVAKETDHNTVGSLNFLGQSCAYSHRDIAANNTGCTQVAVFNIGYCQRAITYDPEDAFSHYLLGLNYAYLAQQTGSMEMLAAARKSFERMLTLNPDLSEADFARKNVAAIEIALKSR